MANIQTYGLRLTHTQALNKNLQLYFHINKSLLYDIIELCIRDT